MGKEIASHVITERSGDRYKIDVYHYQTGKEFLVRGPLKHHQDEDSWIEGHVASFWLEYETGKYREYNPNRSKKDGPSDLQGVNHWNYFLQKYLEQCYTVPVIDEGDKLPQYVCYNPDTMEGVLF
jgi:hypothetical protein